MKYSNLLLAALTATALTFTACGSGDSTPEEDPAEKTTAEKIAEARAKAYVVPSATTLSGDITSNTKLTADQTWILDGLVVVKDYATLQIEPGTVIKGKDGTGVATSYMIIDKDSMIDAQGTEAQPIVFTSTDATSDTAGDTVGQWGGLTIIGNAGNAQVKAYEVNPTFVAGTGNLADNSGALTHVKIFNSGITMQKDKEINGLSLVGVGSGTKIENLTVDWSDDDGVELWGGTVNLTGVTIGHCTDDYFDIDDGYSGTVKDLTIVTAIAKDGKAGNAGIEMSGETAATFDGFSITIDAAQGKEGGIYFKNAKIGGHFKNGTVTSNATGDYGTIHSYDTADLANVSFENVTLTSSTVLHFTNGATDDNASFGSKDELEAKFNAGTNNTAN